MSPSKEKLNKKIQQVIDLLKLSLDMEDQEILISTIESIIETLEEEIKK